MSDCHVRILIDNTTAVAYINGQGGRKFLCNALARDIWEWAISRNIWLSASHIPGRLNVEADRQSRLNHDNKEWKLRPDLFQDLVSLWGTPNIDLFASRLNYQVKPYVSWKRDPEAFAVDAFTIPWQSGFYAFPPFSLLGRVLNKVQEEECEGIVIAPYWTTQPWFSKLSRMLIDCPFLLPRTLDSLLMPKKDTKHSLPRTRLAAFRLSGKSYNCNKFREQLRTSSCRHGGFPRGGNTNLTSRNGWSFVVQGITIRMHHLSDWS